MNKARVEVYLSRTLFLSQRWRWRLVASNNEILAASTEGFYSHTGALQNLSLTRALLGQTELPVVAVNVK